MSATAQQDGDRGRRVAEGESYELGLGGDVEVQGEGGSNSRIRSIKSLMANLKIEGMNQDRINHLQRNKI